MKKILFLGDFISNDGVANANKTIQLGLIKANLNDKALYTVNQNKFARIIEFIKLFFKADVICMCGITKLNYLAITLSKIFKKPIHYLLHGYPFYEQTIEGVFSKTELEKIKKREFKKFRAVDKIICVSYSSMKFMEQQAPNYREKLNYIYNPIDLKYLEEQLETVKKTRDRNTIISTGGGRRIKNNLSVAKAIEEINSEKNMNLIYYVVGPEGPESEKLNKLQCVRLIKTVTHNEVLNLYRQSFIYIQNSFFETFGLAVVESLFLGSNLLISQGVSAKDILPSISKMDMIYDNQDVSEIKAKILYVLENENNIRLCRRFQSDKIDPASVATRLYELLSC